MPAQENHHGIVFGAYGSAACNAALQLGAVSNAVVRSVRMPVIVAGPA